MVEEGSESNEETESLDYRGGEEEDGDLEKQTGKSTQEDLHD